MKAILFVAIALGLAAPRDTPKDQEETKKEVARLQGEWEAVGAEKGGAKLNEEERRKLSEFFLTKVVFSDESMQLWIQHKGNEAKPSDMISFTLDVTKKPRQLKFDKFVIIYAIDGDTLKTCMTDEMDQMGKAPKSFDTNQDEKAYVFVFKKVKK